MFFFPSMALYYVLYAIRSTQIIVLKNYFSLHLEKKMKLKARILWLFILNGLTIYYWIALHQSRLLTWLPLFYDAHCRWEEFVRWGLGTLTYVRTRFSGRLLLTNIRKRQRMREINNLPSHDPMTSHFLQICIRKKNRQSRYLLQDFEYLYTIRASRCSR